MTTPANEFRFEFRFDGEPILAVAGQSIGASLMAAGLRTLRRTRFDDAPRGMFCGIGSCFDCLVTVNGRPSRRACLVEVQPGDVVSTQQGVGHADLC